MRARQLRYCDTIVTKSITKPIHHSLIGKCDRSMLGSAYYSENGKAQQINDEAGCFELSRFSNI